MSNTVNLGAMPARFLQSLPAEPAAGTAAPGCGGTESAEENRKLKSACAEFESFFIQYLLKEMRETVPTSGLMSGGNAESIYTSMLDAELSKAVADTGGIGLADMFATALEGRLSRPGK